MSARDELGNPITQQRWEAVLVQLEEACSRERAVSAYAGPRLAALRTARRVLRRWEELYAEWSQANGHMEALFDRRLPPADHIRALEDIDAALAENPADCPACKGSGEMPAQVRVPGTADEAEDVTVDCAKCAGTGTVTETVAACCHKWREDGSCCGNPIPEPEPAPCPACEGTGETRNGVCLSRMVGPVEVDALGQAWSPEFRALAYEIEALPASEQQTKVATMFADLHKRAAARWVRVADDLDGLLDALVKERVLPPDFRERQQETPSQVHDREEK